MAVKEESLRDSRIKEKKIQNVRGLFYVTLYEQFSNSSRNIYHLTSYDMVDVTNTTWFYLFISSQETGTSPPSCLLLENCLYICPRIS